jgi:hypothetical protein
MYAPVILKTRIAKRDGEIFIIHFIPLVDDESEATCWPDDYTASTSICSGNATSNQQLPAMC